VFQHRQQKLRTDAFPTELQISTRGKHAVQPRDNNNKPFIVAHRLEMEEIRDLL
jgi:hypothetical protein